MARIFIYLDQSHILALSRLSQEEYRSIHEQAAFIIRGELERRGLIDPQKPSQPPSQSDKPG